MVGAMNEAVRQYLKEIGKKGGSAGKGTAWRREVCRHAAVVRWRTYRERKRLAAQKAEEAEQKPTEQVPVETPEAPAAAPLTPEEIERQRLLTT